MSFASETKNELCKTIKSSPCCQFAELMGIVLVCSTVDRQFIRINTENSAVARRIYSLFKSVFQVAPVIVVKKNKIRFYSIQITQHVEQILERFQMLQGSLITFRVYEKLVLKDCCRRAFLRGVFLGSGSVSAPAKAYHLEFVTRHYKLSGDILSLLKEYEIAAKVAVRKSNYVIYIKEGEMIADCLNLIGAHNALMEFQNARILKDMRNNVNRVVNCETANVSKIVNASVEQIRNIELIDKMVSLSSLPQGLEEVARLRLENPEASLKDLGKMLCPPVSKSGVNHRLKKLEQIANELSQKC